MLAKIWKKLLLAICIIAILFNITSKLVNRISLEKAISSTPDGVNIREILNITDNHTTTSNQTNSVSRYKTIEEVEAERATEEATRQENEKQEYVEQETTEEQEKSNTGGKIIDMVTDSITNVKKYDDILN